MVGIVVVEMLDLIFRKLVVVGVLYEVLNVKNYFKEV